MSKNLVEKGNISKPLILYNRTRATADETSAKIGHSKVAETIAELVSEADIIWLCVQNQTADREAFDEILKLDIQGKLFLDCTSLLPGVTDEISQKVLAKGAEFIAMPVFGEPSMAAIGALYCVPAGDKVSVDRIRPYLVGVVGQAVVDLSGEPPRKASLLKMIGNILIMTTIETLSETHVFAEKSGLGIEHMQNLILTLFPRPPHAVYTRKMTSGDYFSAYPMVDVAKAQELAAEVLDLARQSNTVLKSYEVAIEHLHEAGSHAGLNSDITGIYGAVRLENGLPFKNNEQGK